MDSERRWLLKTAVYTVLSQVAVYYGLKYLLNMADPNRERKQAARTKSSAVLRRLQQVQQESGSTSAEALELNEYEQVIASEVVIGDDIQASFESIGGLDTIISELRESVILPLTHPELFNFPGVRLGPPKGVLLYGPPGCGKTMLAKALAKESGATFINVQLSTLTDKWFGESNKLIAALFTVARKLQPTIVFIDEIDSFLRERSMSDHEAMAMIKAEFMSLWDGLLTGDDSRIIIMGATNRRGDIDAAILRRLSKQFAVQLPSEAQRRQILALLLRDNVLHPQMGGVAALAAATEGFSGSSLKDLCSSAAAIPHREFLRRHAATAGAGGRPARLSQESLRALAAEQATALRPLEMRDFVQAARTIHGGHALAPIGHGLEDESVD